MGEPELNFNLALLALHVDDGFKHFVTDGEELGVGQEAAMVDNQSLRRIRWLRPRWIYHGILGEGAEGARLRQ